MMTGLFFGSFNPIHNGHIGIAEYLLDEGWCSEIRLVVSPKNPLKADLDLLDEEKRLAMVTQAIAFDNRLKACNIEFRMPRPSYTIDTLRMFSENDPERQFCLIIGEDNLNIFHLWKNYQEIYAEYRILVYPRPGEAVPNGWYPNMTRIDAPLTPVSSTQIREMVRRGEPIDQWVPPSIRKWVEEWYG